jgi:carbon monoxide dehydrogenase subunit G
MAISLDLDVRIGRPSADVFARLTDVERWPEWLIASGIVKVERLDDGPLAEGSALRIQQRVAGRSSTLDARVTALTATTRFAVTGRDADGISVEIDASLTDEGPATRLDWRLKIGLPLRYRMLESMAAPQVRRAAALDLEAFRQRLESVAGA